MGTMKKFEERSRIKVLLLIQEPYPGGVKTYHNSIYTSVSKREDIFVNMKIYRDFDLIKDKDYDIYHLFFSPVITLSFLIKLIYLKILSRGKIVVTYYNIKKENLVKRLIKSIILNLIVDSLIVPSKNMKKYYTKKIFFKKKIFVYLPTYHLNVCRRNEKTFKSKITLLYFGALRHDKGIFRIYKMCNKLRIQCDIYPILLPRREALGILGKIKNSKYIRVFKRFNLRVLCKKKYILILPYTTLESTFDMPLSLLEGLMMGIPVLTTAFPHFIKVMPKEFLIRDWNDIDLLAKRIKKIDREYRKFSKLSRNSWQKIVDQTDGEISEIYFKIAKN